MSEYLPDSYQARSWFSGFNGSVGTLAVTADAPRFGWMAAISSSGAPDCGSGIELMRIAQKGTPEIPAWLADTLPENGVMGVDGMVTATSTVEKLNKAFEKKHISIRDIDFVTPLWEGRPAAPATPAWLLDVKYAGKTAAEKLAQLREKLQERAQMPCWFPAWTASPGF